MMICEHCNSLFTELTSRRDKVSALYGGAPEELHVDIVVTPCCYAEDYAEFDKDRAIADLKAAREVFRSGPNFTFGETMQIQQVLENVAEFLET